MNLEDEIQIFMHFSFLSPLKMDGNKQIDKIKTTMKVVEIDRHKLNRVFKTMV
jgi:hypothetical protein